MAYKEITCKQLQNRMRMERRIVTFMLEDAIKQGFALSVFNGEEVTVKKSTNATELWEACRSVDEESILFYKDGVRVGHVCLVYGNDGWDVISDYTTNLHDVLAATNRLVDEVCAEFTPVWDFSPPLGM